MPALPEEIAATLEEDITIQNGWGPQRVLGNGAVSGIEFKRCTSVYDEKSASARLSMKKNLQQSEADQIIVAIGQAMESSWSSQSCQRTRLL